MSGQECPRSEKSKLRAMGGCAVFLLEGSKGVRHIQFRQGPWNVDLRTPPGPEGSNGSLLCICRGHPGLLNFTVQLNILGSGREQRVDRARCPKLIVSACLIKS